MTRLVTLLLTSALPLQALAQCPVAGDLSAGIYATDDEGSVTHFYADGENVVEHTAYADSTESYTYVVYRGLIPLGSEEYEAGRRSQGYGETYVYRRDVRAFTPEPDSYWQDRVVTTYEDESEPEAEQYTIATGPLHEIDLAGCTYEAFAVTQISLFRPSGSFLYTQQYIPELGMAVFTSFLDEEGLTEWDTVAFSSIAPEGAPAAIIPE